MGNFKINIGTSTADIMNNLKNLSSATNSTRQKIINFCKSDVDGIVTNTIECTMLNTWAGGKEKIPMPKKPLEDGYKYINGKYKNTQNNTIYNIYGGGNSRDNFTLFEYEKKDGYRDILDDRDGDGFADVRQVNDSYISNPWVQRFDENLDGKFDRYNKRYND